MSWKAKVRIFLLNLKYKRYDSRVIKGIEVHTFWRLNKCIVGPGYLCIPLRLRRSDDVQELVCLQEFRKAMALRILNKNK